MREILHGRIWTARPVTVVQDTPDLIALAMQPGTIYKHPRLLDRDEVPPLMVDAPWRLIDVPWTGGRALYLSRPGDDYMLIVFWQEDGVTLRSWYVNLQDPLHRTRLGFDYLDQELDVIVSPDLSTVRWKDVDNFEALICKGLIRPARGRQLRAIAEEIVRTRRDPGSLFTLGWEHWTPPPEWPLPGLPAGWDVVS
jgi:predicted RNA-binding protein associated with RNAse of E/G family